MRHASIGIYFLYGRNACHPTADRQGKSQHKTKQTLHLNRSIKLTPQRLKKFVQSFLSVEVISIILTYQRLLITEIMIVLIGLLLSLIAVHADITNNNIDQYVDQNGKCALPDHLVAEIQSYQPIVNRITKEILNGPYTGGTWNRYKSLAL